MGTDLRPVFPEEQLLIGVILNSDNPLQFVGKSVWYNGYAYIVDGGNRNGSLYGKEAYKLGYHDGIRVWEERQPDGSRSILSQKDMAHLIYVYDAVKKLNEVMLGCWLTHLRDDGGVFCALDRVFDVIEHSVCSRIKLLGEEESYEVLIGILDDKNATPEERARLLVGA